jgi:hypothetical protein
VIRYLNHPFDQNLVLQHSLGSQLFILLLDFIVYLNVADSHCFTIKFIVL